jgi:pyruvate/2-oxoglutarate dehydrogenase complex dihydrolipoamide dehydrogenase (E3) component
VKIPVSSGCARRTNSDLLNLAPTGLEADPRGRLKVNDCFQASEPHIYTAGDDRTGMLKLLSDSRDLRLLGAHCIGQHSAEIVHIGQAVLGFGGMIGYFGDKIFHYSTLAKAYRVAALNGLNKL